MELVRSHARPFAEYLNRYVQAYRSEWARFTQAPPEGAGYPALRVSPYLSAGELFCYIATDGVAIASYAPEPNSHWYIAGGPALVTDSKPTSVPPEIERLRANARTLAADDGGFIGIYRLGGDVDPATARGVLPEPITAESVTVGGDLRIEVAEYPLQWTDLVARLTFGAFGPILNAHLPGPDDDIWNPTIVRQLGFMAANPEHRRFFNRLELSPHVDDAAWDPRSIWARVHIDLRRDFAHAFAATQPGGYLGVSGQDPRVELIERFSDRLAALGRATEALAGLEAACVQPQALSARGAARRWPKCNRCRCWVGRDVGRSGALTNVDATSRRGAARFPLPPQPRVSRSVRRAGDDRGCRESPPAHRPRRPCSRCSPKRRATR